MPKTENALELPAPGDVVAGKYRIVRAIGRGGMGVVFAATHELLHQTVALKLLLPDVAAHPEAVSRFLNEARAAARIRSEHVATVMDVGLLDGGMAYLVMEYLEGGDLEALLLQNGTMSLEEVAHCMLETLEGVAQAHALGIVHRDLKPSNLFRAVRPDGSVSIKVLDFGISKAPRPEDDGTATATHAMLGSPLFMSPEQVRSAKTVDARSDLWSLGVIMYRLLTGQPPFTGSNMGEVLAAILTEPHKPIAELRPDVPHGFAKIVDRCLERDRDRRYANAAELAIALEPFAGAHTDSVTRICRVLGMRTQKSDATEPGLVMSTQLAPEVTPAVAGSTVLAPQTVALPDTPWPASAQAPRVATPETMLGPSAGPWSATGNGKAASSRRRLRMAAVGAALVLAAAGAITLALRGHSPSSIPTSASALATTETLAPASTELVMPAVRVVPTEVLAPLPTAQSAESPASASSSPAAPHAPSAAAVAPIRPPPDASAPPRPHAPAGPTASARPIAIDNILLQRN